MAKRPTKRKARKEQPVPYTMTFELGDGGTSYIDLSLAASILNRRFYRQGLMWGVAGMTIFANGTNKTVRVATLQNNWITTEAWKKGFALWNKMNDQVLENEPTMKNRYHDFKIFMTRQHQQHFDANGFQGATGTSASKTLLPVVVDEATGASELPNGAGVSQPAENAEWIYSEYQFPDPITGVAVPAAINMNGTTDFTPGDAYVGLISGYGLSRRRDTIPTDNLPEESNNSWVNLLFDLGGNDPEIKDNLTQDNDEPPFANSGNASVEENYPGGERNLGGLQLVTPPITSAAGTDYSGKISIPGFTAPCGLIYLRNDGPVTVQVHLAPGRHRGYLAEPMQDV